MSNGQKPHAAKPGIQKPSISKPAKSAKPTITKPAKHSADNVPSEVSVAFDDFEKHFFDGTRTSQSKDNTIVLTSKYGFFRVYQYDNQGNPSDKHIVIVFFNMQSRGAFEIHGTIARKYLALLKKHDDIQDFPISDELVAKKEKSDRISGLSLYALAWDHNTNDVERRDYNTYAPTAPDVLVACTQEFDPEMKNVNYKNWKGEKVDQYKSSRKLRPTGVPTQVLLHETATLSNLSISGVRKDGDTFLIPHFCINNIDSSKSGNILQFVDIVERTSHGPPMNDRAIGIEFVNAPIEDYKENKKTKKKEKVHKLDESTKGVYLNTVLGNLPKVFVPLEFYPTADEGFTLTVPEIDLINKTSLSGLELGAKKEKAVETKGGVVTINNCRSDKFENLVSLMQLFTSTAQVPGLDLTKKEQYRNVHLKEGKEYFLYQRAWLKSGNKVHFGVDIRLPGVFAHGLTGVDRVDGFAQALYVYLRLIQKLSAQQTLQKMFDLLVKSKSSQTKRPELEITEKVVLVSDKEEDPKSPKSINITDYLDVT